MLTLRPGSQAFLLVSLLAVTGEFPLRSLHLLGNERVLRELVRRGSGRQAIAGAMGQLLDNYSVWQAEGGIAGHVEMNPVDWSLFSCFAAVLTVSGLKNAALLLIITAAVAAYLKFGRSRDRDYDPRGFTLSRDGTYGTAAWMSEQELREVL